MTLWWPTHVFSILDWAERNGGVWSGMEGQENLSSFEVMLLKGIYAGKKDFKTKHSKTQ